MTRPDDRVLAEDLACPVEIQPGFDQSTPADLDWRLMGASIPNAATYHLTHSDVNRIIVDVLRPSDSPPGQSIRPHQGSPHHHIGQLGQILGGGEPDQAAASRCEGAGRRRHTRSSQGRVGRRPGRPVAAAVAPLLGSPGTGAAAPGKPGLFAVHNGTRSRLALTAPDLC